MGVGGFAYAAVLSLMAAICLRRLVPQNRTGSLWRESKLHMGLMILALMGLVALHESINTHVLPVIQDIIDLPLRGNAATTLIVFGVVLTCLWTALFYRRGVSLGLDAAAVQSSRVAVPPESRLIYMGKPWQLALLEDLKDVPFEPRFFVCRVPTVVEERQSRLLKLHKASLLIALPFVIFAGEIWFVFLLLFSAPYLYRVLKPCYLRILPGRVDFLRTSFFGRRLHCFHSIALQRARISARGFSGEILIDDGREIIDLDGVSDKAGLLVAVYQAAISTCEVPEVCKAELVDC